MDLQPLWSEALSRMVQISVLLFGALMVLAFAVIWVYRQLMKDRVIILEQKRQLFDLANRDALTGLFNRHRLQTLLPQKLAALQQGSIHSLAAVILDIDHFKSFNDRFGHDVGDLVLNQVGKAFQSMCGLVVFRLSSGR
ncbi:GGDEF domain-containing protein [Sulfurivirga caldicuralii]|uniref:GGDEF domain-containing protein n=1 Tax=Sulfurivirga caldicuralii TaxID=364032 RepID=UPI001180E356|nr:GGDEF domain-containing protein [Sulfurivirga caldicuralii]